MTREEAIEKLEDISKNYMWACGEYSDVLEIAIEALQPEPCKDVISRQAAISVANDFDATQVVRGLEKLPSVQPVCEERIKGECPYYAG